MPDINLPEWITLPANQAKVLAARKMYAEIEARPMEERAAARAKALRETAAEDGMTSISTAEGAFLDLAIHKDTFLDDASIQRDIQNNEALYWKSRYNPVVGVFMGSLYGGPPATIYQTQDFYATLQPFVVDTEAIQVPNLGYAVTPDQLGIRLAGLKRQQEALTLQKEKFLINTILNQPLGTDIPAAIENYIATGNPYNGRTVYVIDPGVQQGTYETSNIISLPSSGGFSPALNEAIVSQMMLMKRQPRTIHFAAAGQPWRKLFRYGGVTIAANAPLTVPGNTGLNAITPNMYQDIMDANFADGFVLNWFGMPLKFKANNALPQGYAILTTDQPAAEVLNVVQGRVSVDYIADQHNPYYSNHYEKYFWAIAVPDPWARNIVVINYGATSGL